MAQNEDPEIQAKIQALQRNLGDSAHGAGGSITSSGRLSRRIERYNIGFNSYSVKTHLL